ncbi:MAG: hypothetical protein IJ709_00185 [Selenomonas sp.]|nr:hypothetical protein [Selenomonas sp.]
MKKIFTLIAAALMAVGAQAQLIDLGATYTEEQAAGTVNDITLGEEGFTAQFTGGSKAKIAAKSLTFKVDDSSEAETFTKQWAPGGGITKLTGERSVTITVTKAGTLTVYARSASSDDRAFTVQQNGATVLEAVAYNGVQIEEKYYKAWTAEIKAGTANILAESGINISALKFVAAEGGEEGGEETGETTTVASWDKGTASEGSVWTLFNAGTIAENNRSVLDGYTGKYNSNKTSVACMTFASSIMSGEEWNSYVQATVSGGFKTGDVVTLQPFTAMSSSDFTGGSKYANVVIYNSEKTQLYTTGGTAEKKTVTDGQEEDGDPKEFTYTQESDCDALYFGRQGNTRINVIKIVITRATTTAIETVKAAVKADGVMYNLAGQKVGADFKGIVIKDGKKVVIK